MVPADYRNLEAIIAEMARLVDMGDFMAAGEISTMSASAWSSARPSSAEMLVPGSACVVESQASTPAAWSRAASSRTNGASLAAALIKTLRRDLAIDRF